VAMRTTRLAPLPILLLALGLLACGSPSAPPNAEQAPAPTVDQAPADENEVTSPEEMARGVATRVTRAVGDPSRVYALAFRFVVMQNGERAFEAMHHWDRLRERDLVEWTGRDGKARRAVVDLRTHRACGTIDGVVAADTDLDALSEQAYQRFINDSYWFVMPLKLEDPGVHLVREAPRERDGTRYSILHMTFAHVGLTPGDQYWLFINPTSQRIDRWEMKLEGQEGPPTGTSFTDYRDVAGLMLAHDHVSDDGTRHVLFEDTGSFDRQNIFDIEGCS